MQIFVKAKPNASKELIEQIDKTHLLISVKEPPKNGEANAAIIRVLSKHLSVPASSIKFVSGFSSKEKTFEVT